MYLLAPATVKDLAHYIVENPSPFHGDITVERSHIKASDGKELPMSYYFEYSSSTYALNMSLVPKDKRSGAAEFDEQNRGDCFYH